MEQNYLILIDFETYDVPNKKDEELSDEVFSYFLVAICPVKQSKDELSYITSSKDFHNKSNGYVSCSPLYGFFHRGQLTLQLAHGFHAAFIAQRCPHDIGELRSGAFLPCRQFAAKEGLCQSVCGAIFVLCCIEQGAVDVCCSIVEGREHEAIER